MKSVSCNIFHALKKCISPGKKISGIIGTEVHPIYRKMVLSCQNLVQRENHGNKWIKEIFHVKRDFFVFWPQVISFQLNRTVQHFSSHNRISAVSAPPHFPMQPLQVSNCGVVTRWQVLLALLQNAYWGHLSPSW